MTASRRSRTAVHGVIGLGVGAISTALCLWLVSRRYSVSAAGVIQSLAGMDVVVLWGIFLGSALFHVFVGADRLWRVLHCLRVDIGFPEALLIRLASGPVRFLVPFKGGEAGNVIYLGRCLGMGLGPAAGAVAFERSLNLVGAAFWLAFGMALTFDADTVVAVCWTTAAAAIYVVFVMSTPLHRAAVAVVSWMHPRAGRLLSRLLAPFSGLSPAQRAWFMLYGVIFQLRPLVVAYLLFGAAGVWLPLRSFPLKLSIAILAGHAPGLGGLGPREAAMTALFSDVVSADTALAVAGLYALAVHIVPLLSGLPWVPVYLKRIWRGHATNGNLVAGT